MCQMCTLLDPGYTNHFHPSLPSVGNTDFGDSTGVTGNGNPIIEGVLSGYRWSDITITFSFPDESTDYGTGYPGNANNEGFEQISATQQALIRAALEGETWFSFEGFTLATVVDSGEDANAMIRAAYSTDAGASAYAYYPSDSDVGGDMWFGPDNSYDYMNPVLGSTSWRSTLHEIGHALGLSHGHTADGGFAVLPEEYNHHEFSLMTYYSYEGKGGSGYTNDTWSYPQSFMMADIAALQYMYGADFSLNDGNTTYTFSSSTGEMFIDGVGQGTPGGNKIFLTLWDGDGVDTYDLSNYTNTVLIDLGAGSQSEFSYDQLADLGGGPNGGLARGNVYNALMYDDGSGEDTRSLIENATGGSGADMMFGNEVGNVLTGNDGHDAMIAFSGDDTLYGGAGADFLIGAEDSDVLYGGDGNDRMYGDDYALALGTGLIDDTSGVLGNTALATAYSVDSEFTYDFWYDPTFDIEADEVVQHAGATPYVTVVGQGQGTILYYSFTVLEDGTRVVFDIDGGNNVPGGIGDFDSYIEVYGAGGTIIGFSDDSDTTQGSGGSFSTSDSFLDLMIATAGVYTVAVGRYDLGSIGALVTGSTFGLHITMYGEANAPAIGQTLEGAVGQDTLYGGAGDDRMYGGGANDELIGGANNDLLNGGGGNDLLNGSGGNDELIGGGGNDALIGGGGNDFLFGGSGNDDVRGGVGADSMSGGTGSDTLSYTSDTTGVNVNLSSNVVSGGFATGDTIASFENVKAGAGDNTLIGTISDNAIISRGGNDSLYGLDGDDRIAGGGGDDLLRGDGGGDTLNGGGGIDTLSYGTDTIGVNVDIGLNNASGGDATGDIISGFENLIGGTADDILKGTGGDNEIKGGSGNDRLSGRTGVDVLIGGAGTDTLNGGEGNDTLTGGGAADVFIFQGITNADTITDFQVGIDTLKIYGQVEADVTFGDAGSGHTLITLASGDTILVENTSIAQLNTFDDFQFV